MSPDSSFDREYFQQLLVNAFALQESQRDSQPLSAIVTVQRLIAKGELDEDGAMRLIADSARDVANASGVAIGLLKEDQLVYRAGSGIAATYIGRRRLVTLFVSTRIQARREVLRVENAETDARIEAEICRQFGAKSLILLLIYHGHKVAGVLEVLFNEPHAFQEHEVDAYRSMAELVENAIFGDRQPVQKVAVATQRLTVPPPVEPVKRAPLNKLKWKETAAGVAIALMVAIWIAHHLRPASAVTGSVERRSNTAWRQPSALPTKPLPTNRPFPLQTAGDGTQNTNAASSAFKRVRVGQNEIDYIAEDVTIRHFMPKPAPPQVRTWNKQVTIGDDVTVRFFAYEPAVASPTRAVSAPVPNR